MQAFEYASPTTLPDALGLLGSSWGDAGVLAGGTDLLVQMKEAGLHPPAIVSLHAIDALRGITEDDGLRIGSGTNLAEVAAHDVVRGSYTALAEGAGIVAFACDTGQTVWKATAERASYSSPVAVTVDGTRHVIFVTRLSVVSVDPETGKVRFRFPFGRTGPTVTAANPVVFDGHVLVTASYGIGSVLARIGQAGVDVLWKDAEILAAQYATCVRHDGCLFGVDGRQDGPPADLICFDPMTRRVRWTQPSFGYATLLKAGERLLILKTDGVLVLAAANVDRYEELARAPVSDATARALPALADGRLYIRAGRTLQCLAVGK